MPASPEFDPYVQELWTGADPPGGMAVKWCLVIEGLGPEGAVSLDTYWSEGLKTWQLKGMLHEILDEQTERTIVDELRGE